LPSPWAGQSDFHLPSVKKHQDDQPVKPTPLVVEITEEKAQEAITRLTRSIEQGNPLAQELKIAVFGLQSYVRVIELLSRRGISIKDLRRTLGISVEVDPKPPSNPGSKGKGKGKGKSKKGRHPHGRRGHKDLPIQDHRYFAHPAFHEPGVSCTDGCQGRLYPQVGKWHRFEGQPLLRVLLVHYEIWRCTLCRTSFPAPIAQDIVEDGEPRRPFGFSATALISLAKNFLGTPWSRQERMQKMLKLPVSASTLHDQTAEMAEVASPIYELLPKIASNAWRFITDDTGVRILKQAPVVKEQRKTGKQTLRTGVHTSTLLADLKDGIRITLFKSGILHAGEFLDEVLRHRDQGLPPPIHMSDGSSCNPATVTPTIEANCNAHALRKLEEKQDLFPEHWEFVRGVYRDIKKNEAHVKAAGMDDQARQAYHQEHSKPRMEEMFTWMQQELDQKNVEPNSGLGGIFQYFLVRKDKLMAFTKYVGALLTSNAVEQAIKLIALHRKNAGFFMTLKGAWNSDVIMSVGATATGCDVNPYDYFVTLLRYRELVKKDPWAFLPWEYQKTLIKLKQAEREAAAQAPPPPQIKELTAQEWNERQARFVSLAEERRKNRRPRKAV
jgi:transposase